MRKVVGLYGKTFHLWQVDRGDKLPLGMPMLMMSYTKETDGFREVMDERDHRMGTDSVHKAQLRKDIPEPEIHPDADHWDQSKLL